MLLIFGRHMEKNEYRIDIFLIDTLGGGNERIYTMMYETVS